jgi:hypothetical protein
MLEADLANLANIKRPVEVSIDRAGLWMLPIPERSHAEVNEACGAAPHTATSPLSTGMLQCTGSDRRLLPDKNTITQAVAQASFSSRSWSFCSFPLYT